MVLRLRPEARDDLYAAARWYEAQEIGLGRQFLTDVRLVLSASAPTLWRIPSLTGERVVS